MEVVFEVDIKDRNGCLMSKTFSKVGGQNFSRGKRVLIFHNTQPGLLSSVANFGEIAVS